MGLIVTAGTTRTTPHPEPPTDARASVARNVGKTALLVLLLIAAAAAVGHAVADLRGAQVFAFAATLGAIAGWVGGDRAILGSLGARPAAEAELVGVRTAVARLSTRLGIPAPRLYLLDDPFPRALVVGRGPSSARLAVSRGLITSLDDDRLEAVLAHELAHVRARDILPHTTAVLVGITLLELTRLGWRFQRALLLLVAPLAAACGHLVLSPQRELAADRAAASLTSPEAVVDALTRLDAAAGAVGFAASPATSCLYPVSVFDPADRIARMFDTHPPLTERVAALRAPLTP